MLQIELTIKADPALLTVLSALGANLETVALAIDSSLRIRQHEANVAETATIPAPAIQMPPVTLPPAVAAMNPAVVPFPPQAYAAAPTPPAPVTAPVAAAPQYTPEMLGVAGAGLLDAGRGQELFALLGKYGVQAITQLPKEALGAFATDLRAMGARI